MPKSSLYRRSLLLIFCIKLGFGHAFLKLTVRVLLTRSIRGEKWVIMFGGNVLVS